MVTPPQERVIVVQRPQAPIVERSVSVSVGTEQGVSISMERTVIK